MKLQVAEGLKSDVGRKIVRLSTDVMEKLEVEAGDTVKIRGGNETVAKVLRGDHSDMGLDIIRMDGIIRKNAKVTLGDECQVEKIETKSAKVVTLAPAQAQVRFNGDPSSHFKEVLIHMPLMKGDIIVLDFGFGQTVPFVVTKMNPKKPVTVTKQTEIIVSDKPSKIEADLPDVTYEDIGGLDEEIRKVREMVELPMKHPKIFEKLGISPPKGVLLYGPPGTGKTLLAKAVANETNAHFLSINGPEIMSKYYGQSEENLRGVFEEATKNAPAIIFIDEIDSLAPQREESKGEVERRVVSQLLTLMDGMDTRGQVVVIAATNLPNSIDPALRRPGRFDREIQIGMPSLKARKEILQIHTRAMPIPEKDKAEVISKFSRLTHGYSGADLASLSKEAAMKSLRRNLGSILKDDKLDLDELNKVKVEEHDFQNAFTEIEPSGMREAIVEVPNVRWSDVGGLEGVKQKLREMVEWPLKNPEEFRMFGIKPPRGVLLFGPSGTGKTLLAKAVATESEANFIAIRGPELMNKYVGESERAVRKVFQRARQVAPSIIFFDEIDAIAHSRGSDLSGARDSMLNQLLSEMDGIEKLDEVVVLAATNKPQLIDSALLRPGRLDRKIEVPLPDEKAREEIFKVHTKDMPLSKVDLKKLSKKTKGFSGAEIEAVATEAGMLAVKERLSGKKKTTLTQKDFEDAIKTVKENKEA
jgi:transitional endoplasmic reticulum ATPase